MSESFEMDVDHPIHASPPTCHLLHPNQAVTRQRILRRPTSMPILTCQSTDDYYTVAHAKRLHCTPTNQEDHTMESDARTYNKRFHKTKNSCFNQFKDGYESDTDYHPQFRVRERDSTFAMPVEGVFTLQCVSVTHVDVGPPDSARSPMSEYETPQRRKRARAPSGADQTMLTSMSGEGMVATERRPMKKLRASI